MCPKKSLDSSGLIPRGATRLYITRERFQILTKCGLWPKIRVPYALNYEDLQSVGCFYITPDHPDYADMVANFGGKDAEAEFIAYQAHREEQEQLARSRLEASGKIEPNPADFGFRVKKELEEDEQKNEAINTRGSRAKYTQIRVDPIIWNEFGKKCVELGISKKKGYTTAITNMVILKLYRQSNIYNKKISNLHKFVNIDIPIDLKVALLSHAFDNKNIHISVNTALLNYCTK